jgi:hypothetical protein
MDEALEQNWLAAACYPELQDSDYQFIQDFRRKNDAYYELTGPHIPFVFPDLKTEVDDFINEVRIQAEGQRKIDFKLKCAIRNNDRTSDFWHVLLVPDEGFSEMVKLHDMLYSGLFKPIERLDLDFVPHMGIANSTDPNECRSMIHEINAMDIDISGTIDQLDIIQYKDNRISKISTITLDD